MINAVNYIGHVLTIIRSVDLFLQANIGSNAPGNYTTTFENLSKFMIGSCLYIEDLHNGVIIGSKVDTSYSFIRQLMLFLQDLKFI